MAETPAAAVPAPVLDTLLVDTKLTAPSPRTGAVSRRATIDRARSSGQRVVAVSAPAGYGKSSLLAEWAWTETRPVAWLCVDRYDDDPGALLMLISTAYVRAVGRDAGLVADMTSHGPSVLGRAAPRLAAALRTSPTPFVIMIDDLHELRSPDCHDVLGLLVAAIPHGSQLVAASRHEQPHVPRLRVSGDVAELGTGELALDAAGARQIFDSAQVELAPDLVDAVVQRTEGWPAGMYLAALIARDSASGPEAIAGDDPYVTDYLYREALAALPESSRQFLRRTSVLDRLSAELCDSVLRTTTSSVVLREIETSNSFLVPLDRRRVWFRYHSLFREFLLGELRRTEPDVVEQLHTRAADWYERNSGDAYAVEHLLLTRHRKRVVRTVSRLALPTYESGQASTVQRWLRAIGDDAIGGYPPLAVLAGWVSALTGRAREAERWAAAIERATFDGKPADGTASFASARAMLRSFMMPAGPERSLADAQLALAAEPSWSPWRSLALAVAGEALLVCGEPTAARDRFAEGSAVATAVENHEVQAICDAEQALLAMEHGEWDEAAALVTRARSTIAEHRLHDYAAAALAFPAAARLALHRGDQRRADRELALAMRIRPTCTYALPALAVRLRLHTAMACIAKGDAATARHLMREIDDVRTYRPHLGALVAEVDRVRTLLAGMSGEGWTGPPLTAAELRLLPYLQTHLTYQEVGARLFVSRNTVSTEVSSIYRKLGVSSRAAAVERATALGLLGA